ncbi:MAG: hypothetical protein JWN75_979 [Candidatus Saccharibacteria bacterium]|nr:hypothetical protein [Candidatus Saccharibacteria bacterium]
MNIYLDIDGVLITKDLKAANHAEEFVRYIIGHYPDSTYWLTTRCGEDTSKVLWYFETIFSAETIEIMKAIKPISLHVEKTAYIDYEKPFLWFDDNLFLKEKQELLNRGVLDNHIEVNLNSKPNMLRDLINDFPLPVEARI